MMPSVLALVFQAAVDAALDNTWLFKGNVLDGVS